MTNYLLIDGNSLGNIAHNVNKLTLGTLEVQAVFNFLKLLRQYQAIYQHYVPIVLWDGLNWRKAIHNNYKASRSKMETIADMKRMAIKDAYQAQVPLIRQSLRLLGIAQVMATNMEADDLAAILGDRYADAGSKVVLLSGDKDWYQVVRPGIVCRDLLKKFTLTLANFEEVTGVKTPAEFVQVKALAGDSGDDVPGVGGVGEKGAIDFINTYGSFANFLNEVTFMDPKLFKKLPKKYRDLVEDENKAIKFAFSLSLVDLRTTARPPMVGLSLDKGTPDIEKAELFCEKLLFKSITKDFADFVRVFPAFQHLNNIPA